MRSKRKKPEQVAAELVNKKADPDEFMICSTKSKGMTVSLKQLILFESNFMDIFLGYLSMYLHFTVILLLVGLHVAYGLLISVSQTVCLLGKCLNARLKCFHRGRCFQFLYHVSLVKYCIFHILYCSMFICQMPIWALIINKYRSIE